MAEKQANYTAEMVARLHEVYQPTASEDERAAQVVALAEELGKTVKSIRAKLVRESLYVKPEYKTKSGGRPETKENIVSEIAEIFGVDADSTLSGLEKATKNCLIFLRTSVRAFADVAEQEESEES